MSRSIGPLDLVDGIYLRAPEAKPGALLRAMNIERKDGMLRTRRGSSLQGYTGASSSGSGMGIGTGVTMLLNGVVQPLPPGANQVITSSPGFAWQAGELAAVRHIMQNNVTPASLTWEYFSNAGTWKPLVGIDINGLLFANRLPGYVPFAGGGSDGGNLEQLFFVVPEDLVVVDAGFGLGQNIRMTMSAPFSGAAAHFLSSYLAHTAPTTPRLQHVQSRGKSRVVAMIPTQVGTNFTFCRLDERDTFGVIPGSTVPAGTSNADILYIPATNEILLTDGLNAFIVPADSTSVTAPVPFAPATADTVPEADPAYQDLPLEATLQGFSAMALFAGRVFVGGFTDQPALIRWSAPDVIWHAWPSDNEEVLAGGSSGRVVAFAVFADTLFIFTTRGIWTAVIQEGEGLSEGLLFVRPLEQTGCPSDRGVVVCDKGIYFMADDGPRIINGRSPSKPLVPQVQDLFRFDAKHPQACLRKNTVCAAWDRVEQRVLFAYASPGSPYNDVVLVVDMAEQTAWIWGSDDVSAIVARETMVGVSPGPTVQRPRGLSIVSMDWDPDTQKIVCVSNDGLFFFLDGFSDMGLDIPWAFETETIRLPAGERCIVERVELLAAREHFSAFNVTVIPDGDYSRTDTKLITVEPDGVDVTAVLGSANLAGEGLAALQDSFGPARARFRKACRNFRVAVASAASPHPPAAIAGCTVDVTVDGGKR